MTQAPKRMHADEVETDVSLVRRLLAAQFREWADLAVEPVPSSGTDHALYRLGADKLVRLPRRPGAAPQVEKEQKWLPELAPLLPVTVPVPLGKGVAGEGFPFPWSVYPWVEGANPTGASDWRALATDLAGFVRALRGIDASQGPRPGRHNVFRGVPLAARDEFTRGCISRLSERDGVDPGRVTALWEAALAVPVHEGAPVWLHGDLMAGNLLVSRGRLTGVIDFGCLGVGDPACDLIAAWSFLSRERDVFRSALEVDDATWARARGWALTVSLAEIPYYRDTNPPMIARAKHAIAEVLADSE